MKKALALILALIMLSSVVAMFSAFSTVSAVEAPTKAAPVLDGVVYENEYTYSKTTSVSDLSSQDGSGQIQGAEVVEYFAYNSTYVYYAITFTQEQNGNYACWPQFKPNATFNVYVDASGTVEDFHNCVGVQGRYYADGKDEMRMVAPSKGTTPVLSKDIDGVATKVGKLKTYEFKFALSYFAANTGCSVADVRVIPYWTYFHAATSTAHVMTEDDMKMLDENGIGAIRSFATGSTMYRFMVLDSEPQNEKYENIANELKLAYYIGEPVAEEAIPTGDVAINMEEMPGYYAPAIGAKAASAPQQDGTIGDTEYTFSRKVRSFSTNKQYAYYSSDYEAGKEVIEYFSYDDDYIYYAFTHPEYFGTGAEMDILLTPDYIIDSTPTAIPSRIRGIKEENSISLAFGAGAALSFGDIPTGKEAPSIENGDVASYFSRPSGSYQKAVLELKISRKYLSKQMGVPAEEITKFTYSAYLTDVHYKGTSWTYCNMDMVLTNVQRNWLHLQGVTTNMTPDTDNSLTRVLNMVYLCEDDAKLAKDLDATISVKPVTTAPILDGVISNNEYPSMKTTVLDTRLMATKEVDSDTIVEYFGHDAEYIYYAVVFKQVASQRACWPQFKVDNTYDIFNANFDQRVTYQARCNIDPETGNTVNILNGAIGTQGNFPALEDGKDITFNAEKDRETNVKTYEFKISKFYIAGANNIDMADVSVLPYHTFFHNQFAVGPVLTYETVRAIETYGDAGAAFTKTAGATIYNFMILEGEYEDLHKIEDRFNFDMNGTASIRLSHNNPGLRFKTTLSTDDVTTLKTKYKYVKAGTLIAPADFDLDLSKVVNDPSMKEGRNYIDVVADLNNPIGHDYNVTIFAGSITNFKGNNAGRDFEALSYVACSNDGTHWTYFYANHETIRSAAYVAQSAIDKGECANDPAGLAILNAYAGVKYEAN